MTKKSDMLDVSTMENWLWDAACTLRGPTDAPKFKDFILPLIFYKRLSDVFDDEFESYIQQFEDKDVAHMVVQNDHYDALKNNRKPMVRFYIPIEYSWNAIRHFSNEKQSLGEFITEAMRAVAVFNPDLQGVLDVKDYNERQSGQRTIDDDRLAALIEIISRHRLGLKNAEPDILGRAYEYLLRKFAEGQGQSAGEFFTPKEVGWLMARILDPKPRSTVYDPTCGSAGLLIKARLQYEKLHPDNRGKAPKLFGQEQNPITFAMAKMNMFLHDFMDCHFAIGDTFTKPGFVADGTGLKQFDYVIANPMWNQDIYTESFYSNDPYKRFEVIPPNGTADWAWVQHIWSSLNDYGRAAVVLDTGAVSRGSGSKNSNKERDARKLFIEEDRIEGVILLPDNLFYNTSAPGIILFLNKNKPNERKGQVLLVNASNFFDKERPKNVLRMDQKIDMIVNVFKNWRNETGISKIVKTEEIQLVDHNLNPSQFIENVNEINKREINDIVTDLSNMNNQRVSIDGHLKEILKNLKRHTQEGIFPKKKLGELVLQIQNGTTKKQIKDVTRLPVTRIETISDSAINIAKVGYLADEPLSNVEKFILKTGDILFSHINSLEHLGKTAIYENSPELLIHGMNLLLIRANSEVCIPKFLNYCLKFLREKGLFKSIAGRAIGQASINQGNIKNIDIPLPTLPAQESIVKILSTIHDAIEIRKKELELHEELFKVTLEELMNGRISTKIVNENCVVAS